MSHVLLGKIFEAIGFELLPTIDEDLGLGDLSHPLCHDHCRHISTDTSGGKYLKWSWDEYFYCWTLLDKFTKVVLHYLEI